MRAGNIETLYKKDQSRLYFLRRIGDFNICNMALQMFYQSVVASEIFYAAICWGQSVRVRDANKFNKLVRKARSVIGGGVELDSLEAVVEKMLSKLVSILPSTPMLVEKMSIFSQRLVPPRCYTERHRTSFLLVAIKLGLGGC